MLGVVVQPVHRLVNSVKLSYEFLSKEFTQLYCNYEGSDTWNLRCFMRIGGITMFFGLGFKDKKTVKELRKNQNLTARELADKLRLNTTDILKIDDLRLRDLSEPLKTKLTPILRGDYMDNMTWL